MLQHRNSCPEHVKNLCCASYLPVEVFAAKQHFQSKHPCLLMRIHQHDKTIHGKSERAIVEPEVFCIAHKLLEVWDRIGQLIEELDLKPLEVGDCDSRKKHFQVSAGTLGHKPTETRKCDVYREWRTQQLHLNVTAGILGIKGDPEYLELRHD